MDDCMCYESFTFTVTVLQTSKTTPSFHWCCVAMEFSLQPHTICHPRFTLCFCCCSPSLCCSSLFLFLPVSTPPAALLPLTQYHSPSPRSCSLLPFILSEAVSVLFPSHAPCLPCQHTMLCYMRSPSVSCPLLPTHFRIRAKTHQWTYCAHGYEPLSAFCFACLGNDPQRWF